MKSWLAQGSSGRHPSTRDNFSPYKRGLSLANEMYFSIRERVVSHGHDSYESHESTTRASVSRSHIERVANILSLANEMYFSIRQRVVSHGQFVRIEQLRTRKRVSWLTAC